MIQRIPYVIAILTLIGGVFISILFGANEDYFKDKINEGLKKNEKVNQIQDPIEKDATGIGAMIMGVLLFISFLSAPERIKAISSFAVSIGGFLYPFVWLFAAIYGPEMGRSEAKESFAVFGYMGGVFLIGLILSLYMALKYRLKELK